MQQQNRRPRVDSNGEVRRYPPKSGNIKSVRNGARAPQRPPKTGSVKRPSGHPASRLAQRPAASPQRPPQKRQSAHREWVYPEGYKPPRRKQQQKRPPQRRQQKPKQDYSFLWAFLGQLGIRLLIGIVIGCAIVGLMYRNKFYGEPEDTRKDMTYVFSRMEGEETVEKTFEESPTSAYKGGSLMVSFSDLAAWLDMAQVGDIHTMRFVVRGEEDQGVVFHYSSHNAFIGNEIVVMETETRFDGGEVWVPLSFVQSCMKGFDVTVEGETVRISRNGDAPGFALRASEPIAPCEYPE